MSAWWLQAGDSWRLPARLPSRLPDPLLWRLSVLPSCTFAALLPCRLGARLPWWLRSWLAWRLPGCTPLPCWLDGWMPWWLARLGTRLGLWRGWRLECCNPPSSPLGCWECRPILLPLSPGRLPMGTPPNSMPIRRPSSFMSVSCTEWYSSYSTSHATQLALFCRSGAHVRSKARQISGFKSMTTARFSKGTTLKALQWFTYSKGDPGGFERHFVEHPCARTRSSSLPHKDLVENVLTPSWGTMVFLIRTVDVELRFMLVMKKEPVLLYSVIHRPMNQCVLRGVISITPNTIHLHLTFRLSTPCWGAPWPPWWLWKALSYVRSHWSTIAWGTPLWVSRLTVAHC